MSAAPVSLRSQIAALTAALDQVHMSPAQRDLHLQHMEAVRRTLYWLRDHEAEIRAFLALPAADRAAIVAKAGGPAR
jgi:ribosomal 50S subunit-associated protein YjgA (DUF615 family)